MDKKELLKLIDGGENQKVKFKEKKDMTRKNYEKLNNVSKRTAIRDLNELISKNILKSVGTTDDKKYLLNKHLCQTCAKGVIKCQEKKKLKKPNQKR